ncbi:MAG: T9SS type A sorting domain-containing protein [Saprospiraceae bacterium]|nr:T9SS type A sorting domain-containing protein [Saprospiraceae bacterium]MDZ4704552.1 T9SS type A sorting domain-containing protein [Saprospiraceae bacterium]
MSNELQAQCSTQPAAGICSGGNGQLTNNGNINSGQTYWYAGNGSFSAVNINGGTLRVCGQLTLSNINFSTGNIFIEAGGSLTINGGGSLNMNGNSVISNRGQLTINRTVVIQNANNAIFNDAGATLNMNAGAYRLDINSSTSIFVNNGTSNIHTLIVQSSASGTAVCLGLNSCTNLTNLTNNLTNSFNAPDGSAVVSIRGNALLNNPLANNEAVVVCRATASTTSGGASFGSATVINNCSSCSEVVLAPVLPIELLFFNGKQEKESIGLSWATATELDNDYFSIEKSTDGNLWTVLENIQGAGNSTANLQYIFVDYAPKAGIQYYRLKQTDFDGTFTYSAAIAITFEGSTNGGNSISVYPNPNSSNQLNFRGIGLDLSYTLDLKKVTGELLYSQTVNTHSIALPDLEKGIYLITLYAEGSAGIKTFKYIVI